MNSEQGIGTDAAPLVSTSNRPEGNPSRAQAPRRRTDPSRVAPSALTFRFRRSERQALFHAPLLHHWLPVLIGFAILASAWSASGQTNLNAGNLTTGFGPVQITLGGQGGPQDVDTGIKVLFLLTLLTLAPSILLLMTCFTRIVIVLSFVRTALQLQGTPANQIIIGLSLFITYFVMAPVWDNINRDALGPYQAQKITSSQAMDRAAHHLSVFMLKQTRPKDVELFVSMAKLEPSAAEELPLRVVIPSFVISELRTAFQMGFLIYVPFILIDLIVATVLMSMGMMMMPPATISLPLKILLFVLVDGWDLVIHSLVRSFGM
ncbi:MAG TPA: flagellar type III secretion system pore protein FliP [Verrucomicrobiae bacterium]|nr:flagellar type III secretion system pore protein FliP [Verrucomicrobiae bacterium]